MPTTHASSYFTFTTVIAIPILQVGKLRLGEAKWSGRDPGASKAGVGIGTQVFWSSALSHTSISHA